LKRGRWLFAGITILATAFCALEIFWALLAWMLCCGLVRMDLAIGTSALAVVNVFGLVAFAIRLRSWGAPILIAVQAGNILFALAASVAVSAAWLLTDAAPASVILIALIVFQRSEATRSKASA
jgi:hypothetical protein